MSRSRKDGHGGNVQAVDRALSLLEILAKENSAVSISELARKSGLKLSTVHRLLVTMMNKSFIAQDPITSHYKLGIRTFEIGNAALSSFDLRNIARPYLKQLTEKVNETTNLAVLDGAEVIYIDQIESTNIVIVKMFARLGSRGPAYCTGTGKVLLADLATDELIKRLNKIEFVRFTPQTLTNIDQLITVLAKIKQDGFALDYSERDEGVTCVAAPIRNYEGRVIAALSVSGPENRMETDRINNEVLPAVREASDSISTRLGYRGRTAG